MNQKLKLYRAGSGHEFWGLDWSNLYLLDVRLQVEREKADCEEIQPGKEIPPKPDFLILPTAPSKQEITAKEVSDWLHRHKDKVALVRKTDKQVFVPIKVVHMVQDDCVLMEMDKVNNVYPPKQPSEPTTEEKQKLVDQFVSRYNTSKPGAEHYLKREGWNFDKAAHYYWLEVTLMADIDD